MERGSRYKTEMKKKRSERTEIERKKGEASKRKVVKSTIFLPQRFEQGDQLFLIVRCLQASL